MRAKIDCEGDATLSERDLVKAIGATYGKMSRKERVRTIQGLLSGGRLFFLKFFPRFYSEAFPEGAGATGGSAGSNPKSGPS
jgi:hypothetical protein